MNGADVDSLSELAFMATSVSYWGMKLSKGVGRLQKLYHTTIVQLFHLTIYSQKFFMSSFKTGK